MTDVDAQGGPLSTRPPTRDASATFARFRREIDALLDTYIPRGRPAALLQFPYDGNVGNHMLWVSTTDYLRDRGIPLAYVAHTNNFSSRALGRVIGDGPILFLGGVTISKLWPSHAAVKRQVAANFPQNPIVSLPATILFADDDDRKQARTIFGDHPNVTVMGRDPLSTAQAREVFPSHIKVLTVPDLALRLPAQPMHPKPEHEVIWLARNDVEALVGAPPDTVHVFDWPWNLKADMPQSYYRLRLSGVLSHLRSSPLGGPTARLVNPPMVELYRSASESILRYGNKILDTGKVLVTDRMHPHVLTALRDQHAVLLPDRFGKNRAVFDHFTHEFAKVHWADTPAQALDLARALAQSSS